MKPQKSTVSDPQGSLFQVELVKIIDMSHPLAVLAGKIDWCAFDDAFGPYFCEDSARSTVFNNRPNVLCVSGLTAGAETDSQILSQMKEIVPGTPVFANTGCRKDTIAAQLAVADGAVVGTTFKVDGKFENLVNQKRVAEFMKAVHAGR